MTVDSPQFATHNVVCVVGGIFPCWMLDVEGANLLEGSEKTIDTESDHVIGVSMISCSARNT